jgi:hypothetical protein
MPTAFGYCRQPRRNEQPLELQQRSISRVYDRLDPRFKWGGFQIDAADVRNLPFVGRPVGHVIDALIEQGDCIIAVKPRTCFASLEEFHDQLKAWCERGVQFHFAERSLDSSQFDEHACRWINALGGLESNFKSEVAALSAAERRAKGRPTNQHPGLGFRWEEVHGEKVRVVDKEERRTMAEIVRLRDEGVPWEKIYFRFLKERRRNKHGNLPNRARTRRSHHWTGPRPTEASYG